MAEGTTYRDCGREPKDLRINGNWFIDLDAFFDTEKLASLHHGICRGIALSSKYVEPVVIGSKEAQYDMSIPEVQLVMQAVQEDPVMQKLKDQPFQVQYDYVRFAYPSVALGKKLLLRTYRNYHQGFALKHLARVNYDTPARDNFPELMQFIHSCGAFSQVGRVIIFLTERGAETEVHCDYADGKSRKDQFIWLNPQKLKKFFVLDTKLEKQYLTGMVNTFDNATWHGGDPSQTSTYSIRVDGVFDKQFLRKTGLDAHFS